MEYNLRIKVCTLLVFTLFTLVGRTQSTLNSYKYIVVPQKFSFSKENNQYSLNMTLKFLLEQKGFVAFMANEQLPSIITTNKCNALTADVTENNTMFVTKLTLLLKDCQGNIIFKSKEGKSREKEFTLAYNQALSEAFSSFNDISYTYDSTINIQQQATEIISNSPSIPVSTTVPGISDTLYAQGTPNGYQLIDTTPKKALVLFKTSTQDYFIAEAGTVHGVIFKKNAEWIFEYYKDNKLVSRKLSIRF